MRLIFHIFIIDVIVKFEIIGISLDQDLRKIMKKRTTFA
ncbi:hypothetical protein NSP_23400 [Nodularia spumigena CCY9414]|nr:hypothetical protein NSP_23400 [Nodularia spumigena CCY9414]